MQFQISDAPSNQCTRGWDEFQSDWHTRHKFALIPQHFKDPAKLPFKIEVQLTIRCQVWVFGIIFNQFVYKTTSHLKIQPLLNHATNFIHAIQQQQIRKVEVSYQLSLNFDIRLRTKLKQKMQLQSIHTSITNLQQQIDSNIHLFQLSRALLLTSVAKPVL